MKRHEVVDLFNKLVAIESVSTDKSRFGEIIKAVNFLSTDLKKMGFEVHVLKKNNYPPLVLAKKFVPGVKSTIGIYSHYDVQPEDPLKEWRSPPFKLTLKNGKFFGRGVADDKGHVIQNLTAISKLIETKKLKNNIVFIFEGEEESGSCSFEYYVKQAKQLLSGVDVFYVTDTGAATKNIPQIFYGLRGIVYFELRVEIGKRDLHSGVYGNRIYNPAQILANLLMRIKTINSNHIKIPHFYDQYRKPPKEEIKLLKKAVKRIDNIKKYSQAYKILEFDHVSPSYANKIIPSFDVHGIISGYIGQGEKTIIPKRATMKFSFRLVENQQPAEIEKLASDFIRNNLPEGVKYELKTLSKSAPFYTSLDNLYIKKTAGILEKVFGNECLFNRSGGSVPAAEILARLFKKPVILTGFTLPDDNLHAPNENFDEEMFFKGIKALEMIYSQ